jgi:hypothetical protein
VGTGALARPAERSSATGDFHKRARRYQASRQQHPRGDGRPASNTHVGTGALARPAERSSATGDFHKRGRMSITKKSGSSALSHNSQQTDKRDLF